MVSSVLMPSSRFLPNLGWPYSSTSSVPFGPGYLYLTVELQSTGKLEIAFQYGRQQGLPLVEGEVVRDGGYHYYPSLPKVWDNQAKFDLIDITEGDGYYHGLAVVR